MSAVSRKVTPCSIAASTTARVPSRSTRRPKLLQPRPTAETSSPESRRARLGTCAMRLPCPIARFVIQLHDATARHFDLRLQIGGVLRSWAVPRGPSLDPAERRLAVAVADHTLEAGEFEGVHPGAPRGTGAVIIWD